MTLVLMDDGNTWDTFAGKSPDAHVFHCWDFLKLLEKHTGFELLPYGIYKGNELVCLFPLFCRSVGVAKMLCSPPPGAGVPFMGIAMSQEYHRFRQRKRVAYNDLVATDFCEALKKIAPDYISVVTSPAFKDIREFKWNDFGIEVRFAYSFDLAVPTDSIRESMKQDVADEIKRYGPDDLILKRAPDSGAVFDRVRGRQKRGDRSPDPMGRPLLEELMNRLPDHVQVYHLYHREELISSAICYEHGRRIVCQAGAVGADRSRYALELLVWELLREKRTVESAELVITGTDAEQFCRAVSAFNPRLVPYFRAVKCDLRGRLAMRLHGVE